MNSLPGEAKKSTALATSSGVATRPSGLWARIAAPASPASRAATRSVSTNPGATTATKIPCGARRCASDWLMAFNPALLAA